MGKKTSDTIQNEEKIPFNEIDDELDNWREQSPKLCTQLPFDIYPWIILGCICFLTFGSYWVYDTPGAIQTQLTGYFDNFTSFGNYTNFDNSLLYSVYSVPNVILAFFGGYIVDRFTGVRVGSLLFCGLVFIGQFIFSLGIQFEYYWVCVFGRFVFGLGGESLTVSQSTFTARWFDGSLLALAFGITVSFSRIGSSINFIVTPTLAGNDGNDYGTTVPRAVWFGTLMTVVSLAATLIAGGLDYFGRAKIAKKINAQKSSADAQKPSIFHVKYFPLPAWINMLCCMFFYIAVLVFYQVASGIIQFTGDPKHRKNAKVASYYISIPNIVAIFASPLFGFIIDRYGKALYYILVASLALTLGHVGFFGNSVQWWYIPPAILMVWIGISYSMGAAAMWPILANVVHTKLLATGYGTMTSLQNFGLAIFPLFTGLLQTYFAKTYPPPAGDPQERILTFDETLQWNVTTIVFIGCAFIAAGLAILNIILDKAKTEGRLNASKSQRDLLPPLPDPLLRKKSKIDPEIYNEGEYEEEDDMDDEYYKPADPWAFEEVEVSRRLNRTPHNVRMNYLSRLGIGPNIGR
eukprot:TRINITY_DN750_c0_g1_i1.p1 TRINITY_DN750_c0_g1~~TRINITY_DN750_c0_g1_i1.p1  ORF type:complete len:577 (+),score=200.66 TRINITY_DN750_c0_g1_i1:127-1857(+)